MQQCFRVASTHAPVGAWTPEEAARYTVRRDVLFLQALLKDRAMLAAAREEGLVAPRPTPHHASEVGGVQREGGGTRERRTRKPRKKTEARKAIEQGKLEAKHERRRQQLQRGGASPAPQREPPQSSAAGGSSLTRPPGLTPAESASASHMEVEPQPGAERRTQHGEEGHDGASEGGQSTPSSSA